MKKCLESGINSFDTAELYGRGKAEKLWGKIFKEINEPRENLVIATKVWRGDDEFVNSNGTTNKKYVKFAVKRSLENLQMDYVDLVYAHGYDFNTPIE